MGLTEAIVHGSGVPEEPWCPAHHRRAAALRAFRRVRRQALLGRVAHRLGLWQPDMGVVGVAGAGPEVVVPISAIVGQRGAHGNLDRPLPPLGRAWQEAWVRRYLEGITHPTVRVHMVGTAAYLEGGGAALLTLGVLKARGVLSVRVRPGPTARVPHVAAYRGDRSECAGAGEGQAELNRSA